MRRAVLFTAIAVLMVAMVAYATGYVVVLKNGHKIRCSEPLRIDGPNAIITLVTGVVTSYPLDQVDLIESERYNKLGVGDALLLDNIGSEGTPIPTPTPKRSLGHYASINSDATDDGMALKSMMSPTPTPTPGIKLQSTGYHDERITRAFSKILDDKSLYLYRLSAGTQPNYLFIQTVTDSEREVFRALDIVAEAFVIIHRLHPDLSPEAVELQMVQTTNKAAGTFRLTPELAAVLAEKQMSVEEFYVKNVIF